MSSDPHGPPNGQRKGKSAKSPTGADALGYGITIAGAIALFLWLGDMLDGRLGTSPLFAFLGMFIGAAAGFYRLYADLVLRPRWEAEQEEKEEESVE